jgi:uncharacterized protein (TIGR01777 family)
VTERVAITGASGLIGRALTASLLADGHTVLRIGRGIESDLRWDPARDALDPAGLQGVTAVVHLAGANVGERWSSAHKRAIVDSRVQGTGCIARAIAAMSTKPRVLVSASAIGIYGSRGDEWLDEQATLGDDFLARTGVQWERAADPARDAGIRVVHPRTGVVLALNGGALAKMLPVFRLGGGAPVGTGKQWMSWLSLDDTVAIIRFLIARDDLSGAVNAVTAEPVTNASFTSTLASVLHRPAILPPVPAFVLRTMFGEMADGTVLASQRVRPGVLSAAGYRFAHPTVREALQAILAPPARA